MVISPIGARLRRTLLAHCTEQSLRDVAVGDPIRVGEDVEVLGRSIIDWKLCQERDFT